MGRCYNCQVHFEEELKWNKKNKIGEKNNKHFFWVKLQQLKKDFYLARYNSHNMKKIVKSDFLHSAELCLIE
jgi:hypothetical protein